MNDLDVRCAALEDALASILDCVNGSFYDSDGKVCAQCTDTFRPFLPPGEQVDIWVPSEIVGAAIATLEAA